jgi:hypothetical protein
MNDAALLRLSTGAAAADDTSVQAMFEILDARIRVISSSVNLLRQWSMLYAAFRVRPAAADITVVVGSSEDRDDPQPGEAAVIVGDLVRPWTGDEPLFPPLWLPPLDGWLYLRGSAVGRAGEAVLLLSEQRPARTLLSVAMLARGAWLLADEIIPLDPQDLLAAPFPKALILDREALGLLGIDLAHPALMPFRTPTGEVEWRADPQLLLGAHASRVAADAGALVFLESAGTNGRPRLMPLARREALGRLCAQLHRMPAGFQASMETLVRLCNRTPAYTLAPGSAEASARLLDEELLL